MKYYLLFLFLLPLAGFAQIKITGNVVNAADNKPVANTGRDSKTKPPADIAVVVMNFLRVKMELTGFFIWMILIAIY